MDSEVVEINNKGRKLRSRLHPSGKYEYSKGGVLVTHSWRNDIDMFVCREAAYAFQKEGYNVLRLNLTGHGNSEGQLRDISYKTITEDVESAARYIQERFGYKKIGGFGISLGAAAIGFSDVDFGGQILLSPRLVYTPDALFNRYKDKFGNINLLEEGHVELESVSGRGNFEMGYEWIKEMIDHKKYIKFNSKETPTLIVQGMKDELLDAEKFNDFLKRYSCDVVQLKNADHEFSQGEHRKLLIDFSVNWFNQNLI